MMDNSFIHSARGLVCASYGSVPIVAQLLVIQDAPRVLVICQLLVIYSRASYLLYTVVLMFIHERYARFGRSGSYGILRALLRKQH